MKEVHDSIVNPSRHPIFFNKDEVTAVFSVDEQEGVCST
jgi:hypothetical protein